MTAMHTVTAPFEHSVSIVATWRICRRGPRRCRDCADTVPTYLDFYTDETLTSTETESPRGRTKNGLWIRKGAA